MKIDDETLDGLPIEKGGTLSVRDCLAVLCVSEKAPETKIAFALLELRNQLEKRLRATGHSANLRVKKGVGIQWLTDAEAIGFNRRRRVRGDRSHRRSNEGLLSVDPSELSDADRDRLDRERRLSAMRLMAVRRPSLLGA